VEVHDWRGCHLRVLTVAEHCSVPLSTDLRGLILFMLGSLEAQRGRAT
jgi:hypothetical protein